MNENKKQEIDNKLTQVTWATSQAVLDTAENMVRETGFLGEQDQFMITSNALIQALAHMTIVMTSQHEPRARPQVERKFYTLMCDELRHQMIRFRAARQAEELVTAKEVPTPEALRG